MFLAWDITIPANTSESAPTQLKLLLPHGIISKISVKFPSGCNGMVKVRFFRWAFKLIPLSSGDWLTGNDETVITETAYKLTETPFHLQFEGCSPSTTYQHIISVRVEVIPESSLTEDRIVANLEKIVEAVTVNG